MDVITTMGMSTTWLPGRVVPWEWRNHRDALRVPTWGGEEAVEGGGGRRRNWVVTLATQFLQGHSRSGWCGEKSHFLGSALVCSRPFVLG